jgi:hypothetical protein
MPIDTTMSAIKLRVRQTVAVALIAAVLPLGAYAQVRRVSACRRWSSRRRTVDTENANLGSVRTGNSIACQLVRKYDALARCRVAPISRSMSACRPWSIDPQLPETLAGGTVVIPLSAFPSTSVSSPNWPIR